MLESLAPLLAGMGPAVAVLGALIGAGTGYLNRKEQTAKDQAQRDHELAMKRVDLEHAREEAAARLALSAQEAQARAAVALAEGDAREELGRLETVRHAISADLTSADELRDAGWWRWLFVLASAANKLMRPTAFYVLVGAATAVNVALLAYLATNWEALPAEQRLAMVDRAWNWLTAQATGMLTFVTVARGPSR